MIGKTEWFTRRKYSGWGLTPVKWQGWAYIAFIIATGYFIQSLAIDPTIKTIMITGLIAIALLDTLHIMASIKLDEREAKIEAIAERNAAWVMIGTLAAMLMYVLSNNVMLQGENLAQFIILPMITGIVGKATSAIILRNKAL